MSGLALPRGVVTGLGALPGTDSNEAARLVIGELAGLPHIPELPARGPWAQPMGRAAAVLVDLPLELDVERWRSAPAAGRDLGKARSMLAQDLDAVEEQWAGYHGAAKLQLCGPLTLMASVELRGGDAFVADQVARDDLTASLVEGLISHIADLRRRVPGATWCVQLDEPRAHAVTRGEVARPSGWGAVPAVEAQDAATLLRRVVDAAHGVEGGVVVHSCDPDPDWGVLTASDADAIGVDLSRIGLSGDTAGEIEQWWGAGMGLWCGVTTDRGLAAVGDGLDSLRELASLVGADPEAFAQRIVLTPQCDADVGAHAYADLRTLMRRLSHSESPSESHTESHTD